MTMTAAARTAVEGFRRETKVEQHPVPGTCYIVHALGRDYHVSAEMARIFLRQVERVLESDTSALVILRHAHGVELLLVTDDTSFSIRPAMPGESAAAPASYPRMRG